MNRRKRRRRKEPKGNSSVLGSWGRLGGMKGKEAVIGIYCMRKE